MEKLITIETEHAHHSNKIKVDNSTEFKDFGVEKTGRGRIQRLDIQRYDDEGVEVVEINNVKLKGREVALLKEFLNQKL